MTKVIFIGGTGTDIVKTYVTCLLLRQLRTQGFSARAIKPVISGFDANDIASSDSGQILMAMEQDLTLENVKRISPWRYEDPLPPHIAAADAGEVISGNELLDFCNSQAAEDLDYLLIEGVGGIMVPLNYNETMLDILQRLGTPCLLVTGSYLGTISHTMTAISCLDQKNVPLAGLVISAAFQNYINFDLILDDFTKMLPNILIKNIARNDCSTDLTTLIKDGS